jgi:4a-hydroxytetrahydrobiopterin dehydratase
MPRLDDAARKAFLDEHAGWQITGETLRRQFVFADFTASIAFVVRVAFDAEAADHHPDIDIRWNKVTLALSTHEVGALTHKDTELASKIDAHF